MGIHCKIMFKLEIALFPLVTLIITLDEREQKMREALSKPTRDGVDITL